MSGCDKEYPHLGDNFKKPDKVDVLKSKYYNAENYNGEEKVTIPLEDASLSREEIQKNKNEILLSLNSIIEKLNLLSVVTDQSYRDLSKETFELMGKYINKTYK